MMNLAEVDLVLAIDSEKDGSIREVVPMLDDVEVSSAKSPKAKPVQADWTSASNISSYGGAAHTIYEKLIFNRHRFEYKPSKGPNAGKWVPIWKTNKLGETIRYVDALPEEGYQVLKNSKNAVAKYANGKNLTRAGKVIGTIGIIASVYDGVTSKDGWKNHHTADVVIGVVMTFGPVGWIGGLTWFAADMITQGITGKSITENLFD